MAGEAVRDGLLDFFLLLQCFVQDGQCIYMCGAGHHRRPGWFPSAQGVLAGEGVVEVVGLWDGWCKSWCMG